MEQTTESRRCHNDERILYAPSPIQDVDMDIDLQSRLLKSISFCSLQKVNMKNRKNAIALLDEN